MTKQVPSTGTILAVIARLTLVRLSRGKVMWVAIAIACLPVLFATGAGAKGQSDLESTTFAIEMLVLAVMPPLFVASSIGEEIEERTTTYLWSRPLARWTVLAGKLIALAPFSVAVVVVSWIAAMKIGAHQMPSTASVVGLAAGALAIAFVAAGIATISPKNGMAMAIVYVLFVDLLLGGIPASIQYASITHATRSIAGLTDASPLSGVISMVVVAGLWLGVAFRRIRRLES